MSALPDGDAEIVLAPEAEQDLDEIWAYYALSASEDLADRVVAVIASCIERLRAHPLSGSPRMELKPELRAPRAPPYLAFYRAHSGIVEIVRILQQRRDHQAEFSDEQRGRVTACLGQAHRQPVSLP